MQTYQNYLDLKKRLDHELEIEKLKMIDAVISEIRMCVKLFNLTARDVFPPEHQRQRKRRAKYYDPVSGCTWSGVGREPHWIKGKNRKEFLLSPVAHDETQRSLRSGEPLSPLQMGRDHTLLD
ncbi:MULTISPECIES: H-NS family nucleoid-associated regulatory protein [Burkholderia]|uniref:H-NS histone family protein n=1 Tax=Burkholderia TaxID=32008 RepID=UPI0009BFCF42|nr:MULTISPECIES: H-NS histone family protein [Burkholderia]RQV59064.1 H-NS histone family protein [Burkholderia cenocepacia]MCA7970023.1 H-NS histone family protein [Burkholderia sp. AU39826]QRR16534.1 H-NS histone family protein [Burkholderia sp. MS389]QVN13895.1 H-NS histone family protein [Burkholderia sp. LAS2]CAG2322154.1 regulatory protein [Burkholderia cenocepacia]